VKPAFDIIAEDIAEYGPVKVRLYDGLIFFLSGVLSRFNETFEGAPRTCYNKSLYRIPYREIKEVLD
jgi:hypothetical protein